MPEPVGGWNDYRSERTAFVPWVHLLSDKGRAGEVLWQSFARQGVAGLPQPAVTPVVYLLHRAEAVRDGGPVLMSQGYLRGGEREYDFQALPDAALVRCDVQSPRFWDVLNHAVAACGLAWSMLAGGVLLHSSSVHLGRGVHLFAGPSGIGKTTLATWAAGAGAMLRSVDQTLVIPDGSGGWNAVSADSGERVSEPLARILVIRRGAPTRLHPLAPARGLKALLPNIILWPGAESLYGTLLDRAQQLVSCVPLAMLEVDLGTLTQREVFGG